MRLLLLLATCLLLNGAVAQEERVLNLDELLKSVELHHPKIAAALADNQLAQGELLAAKGGFDPQLDAYAALRTGGYYELRRLDVELRQPTPVWGAEVWAGYRLGQGVKDGSYPTYYSDQTLDGGELRAGLQVPLWRNGPIDERRVALERANTKVDGAQSKQQSTKLELFQKATDVYFAWVAAGRKMLVAEQLLTLAATRQTWVEARAQSGLIAPVERLEAERAVLERERTVISARRSLQANTLLLALFLRDQNGEPRLPTLGELPLEFSHPEAIPEDVGPAAQRALMCHPQLQAKRADLELARVNRDLAKGLNAPKLDIKGQISRDMGEGSASLAGTVFEASLEFSMPLAMRQPRGKQLVAEAQLSSLQQEVRLLEDTVQMRLKDSASAFLAASEQWSLAMRLTDNIRALAGAEQKRFEAGAATLFIVNQREQSLVQAEVALVDAARNVWRARSQWDALSSCG